MGDDRDPESSNVSFLVDVQHDDDDVVSSRQRSREHGGGDEAVRADEEDGHRWE